MELNEVIAFPIGGVTVLFGILALVVTDCSLTALWAPQVRAGPRGSRRRRAHGLARRARQGPLPPPRSSLAPNPLPRRPVLTSSPPSPPSPPKDYKDSLAAASLGVGGADAPPPAAAGIKAPFSGCSHSKAPPGGAPRGAGHGHAYQQRHGDGAHDAGAHGHSHGHAHGPEAKHDDHSHSGAESPFANDLAPTKDAAVVVLPPAVSAAAAAAALFDAPPPPHTHACTSALTAQRWAGAGAGGALTNVRQRVTAYTMELGCIFHSIIIGVGVGVITGERQLVISLMVGGCFSGRVGVGVGPVGRGGGERGRWLGAPRLATTLRPRRRSLLPLVAPPPKGRPHRAPGPGGHVAGHGAGADALPAGQEGGAPLIWGGGRGARRAGLLRGGGRRRAARGARRAARRRALSNGGARGLTSPTHSGFLDPKVVMVVLYSLTTSVGIAIGIALSASYDPDSVTSKAVQGTLNGISGGMLL
jgi:hypothetical protein